MCLAVFAESLSKESAQSKCQSINPSAKLIMPKTAWTQTHLEDFANLKNFSDGKIFLGMSKNNGHWYWDDGTPVFVRCKKEIVLF